MRTAIRAYDRALALESEHPEAHGRIARMMKLSLGEYIEGFAEYESRWQCSDAVSPNFTQPLWNGESIAGKTIVLIVPSKGWAIPSSSFGSHPRSRLWAPEWYSAATRRF